MVEKEHGHIHLGHHGLVARERIGKVGKGWKLVGIKQKGLAREKYRIRVGTILNIRLGRSRPLVILKRLCGQARLRMFTKRRKKLGNLERSHGWMFKGDGILDNIFCQTWQLSLVPAPATMGFVSQVCSPPVFKVVARVLGAIASLSFAVLACRLFAEPKLENFSEFCHWIGTCFLGVFVGGVGFYAEVRSSMQSIATHFRKFAMNRIGLCVFYFWLGCYVMGGDIGDHGKSGGWSIVAHVTAIVAWVAAVLDLGIAFCADTAEDEEGMTRKSSGGSV